MILNSSRGTLWEGKTLNFVSEFGVSCRQLTCQFVLSFVEQPVAFCVCFCCEEYR